MCVLVPSSVNCSTHNCFGVADWLYPGDGFLNTLHTIMTNEKVMWTAHNSVSSEISHCTLHMHIVLNMSLRV